MDKASIQSSTLLAMTASLFEGTTWSNPTKNPKQSVEVGDGHLSLLGCCTTETYARMWTSEAIAIGLPNRLWLPKTPSDLKTQGFQPFVRLWWLPR